MRFSTPVKARPSRLPAPAPLICHMDATSGPISVSSPPPPSMPFVMLPPDSRMNVSAPDPPTKSSMPKNSMLPAVPLPTSAAEMFQMVSEDGPKSVSLPPPPSNRMESESIRALKSRSSRRISSYSEPMISTVLVSASARLATTTSELLRSCIVSIPSIWFSSSVRSLTGPPMA